MSDPYTDPWRHEVSSSLGEIKANIGFLVEARKNDDARIKKLETRQDRRDGVIGVAVLILPFLVDPIKKIFYGA